MLNRRIGSPGVLQIILLNEYPINRSITSLSFVESLSLALRAALTLARVRLSQLISTRFGMLQGVLKMCYGRLAAIKTMPFSCIIPGGAVRTFALSFPPYFIPLSAQTIGLSVSTGEAMVTGFNACSVVGRITAGFVCDGLGSTIVLFLTTVLNDFDMLAIWPRLLYWKYFQRFFLVAITTINSMIGSGQAVVAMGMVVTGLNRGSLIRILIVGRQIAAIGADRAHTVAPYGAAMFHVGDFALASAAFVLITRSRMGNEADQENVEVAGGKKSRLFHDSTMSSAFIHSPT